MTNESERPSVGAFDEAAFDAEMTAEDPRFPARKAACEALEKYVQEWIDGYEFDDGECNHAPTELESLLIHDAFAGLSEDEEYLALRAAWKALCGPVSAPPLEPVAWLCEFMREDDTTDRQVLLEDPECTRWADCADGDGVSPYRVTPLFAVPPLPLGDRELMEKALRAFEIADSQMMTALTCYGQQLAGERYARCDSSRDEFTEAVEWLLPRGYIERDATATGEVFKVLRLPEAK